jgi:hypothetical protein
MRHRRDKTPTAPYPVRRLTLNRTLAAPAATTAVSGEGVFSACVMVSVAYVASPVASFVSVEVVETLLSAARQRPMVAVSRVEAVVYVAVEAVRTMEPGTGSKKQAADKPVGAVVAVGSAVIRRDVIIPVGTFRRDADVDLHLSLCFGSGYGEADCSNSS